MNQITNPDAWKQFVDPYEPPEITALWTEAQRAFHAAMLSSDLGMHPAHTRKLRGKAYAALRALRAAGVFPVKSNASPGRHNSQLTTVGEYELKRRYASR